MMIATFQLTSATTNGVAPFSIGHAFKQGDVPAGSQLVGDLTDLQVVAKNAWPDGSLKFAMVSGRAPLVANTALPVNLMIGSPTGGAAFTTANLKATGITAAVDAGSFGIVSWATTDWDTPFQTWISGPKMCSWVYRKPVGSDPHLVAWLEVRLWSGGEVEVLPWIENGYLTVAGPTVKQDTFNFSLGGVSRFNAVITFPHHTRSPLLSGTKLSHWLGVDPDVTPTHDKVYLRTTQMVPNYFASATDATVNALRAASPYTPLQQGDYEFGPDKLDAMTNTGYGEPIGLLPGWDAKLLTCSDTVHATAYAAVIRNGYGSGRYPIHYRDEATYRVPLITSNDTRCLWYGTGNDDSGFHSQGGSTTSTYCPAILDTSGTKIWDTAHSPAIGVLPYLLTGRWYFMEEAQFAAITNFLGDGADPPLRDGVKGLAQPCYGVWQVRACAWMIRALAHAIAVTPDADTTTIAAFRSSFQANIDFYHARYVAQPNNPLGYIYNWDAYDSGVGRIMSPWQDDFFTACVGYAASLGLPLTAGYQSKLDAFFTWKAHAVVMRLGTAAGWNFINAFPYNSPGSPGGMPDYAGGTGPWYTSELTAYNDTWASPPPWFGTDPNTLSFQYPEDPARGLMANALPAIAYAVQRNVPGATAAYSRLTGADNWASFQPAFNTFPVWGMTPLEDTSVAIVGIGHVMRVDTADYIPGFMVCDTDVGFGVLASEIPTGFANPSLLANDVDGADPVGTVYRIEDLTGPSVGKLVINPDGSAVCTPPAGYNGMATGTQRVWKNNMVAYDTTYSYASGNQVGVISLIGSPCTQQNNASTGMIIKGVIIAKTMAGSNCIQLNASSTGVITQTMPIGYVFGALYDAPAASATIFTLRGGMPYAPKHPLSQVYFGLDLADWLALRGTTLVSVTAVAQGIELIGSPFIQGQTVLAKFGLMDTSEDGVNSCTFLFTCSDSEVGAMTLYFDVVG